MPRDYKRTTNRQSWVAENMKEGVQAVFDGTLGYFKAAQMPWCRNPYELILKGLTTGYSSVVKLTETIIVILQ
ncbi:hypothetical protein B5X24_HaOG216159 [Helicoverpa armigera]|nr:hypothetical protein B5X24_HaOG216159 [Helicoverpa armigera]